MSKIKNIKGQKFGKLRVLRYVGKNIHRVAMWQCLCDCGRLVVTQGRALRSGNTKSCGCWQKGKAKTHGMFCNNNKGTRTYRIWAGMLSRCRTGHPNYGGRGIKVCERWYSFANFLSDMGECPSKQHSIDRYPDNDGDYEPSNCRWATKHEQDTNRRQTRLVTYDGKTMCIKDWSTLLGMSYDVLLSRFNRGWPAKKAFTIPIGKRGYHDSYKPPHLLKEGK